MKVEVKGSSEFPYIVDTKEVTCTCANFRYRCRHFSITHENRICKHIQQVFDEHPELKPSELIFTDRIQGSVIEDGKVRYPRSAFSMYIKEISSVIEAFSNIIERYEICGSYRRMCDKISDLDYLIVIKEGSDIDIFYDYLEVTYGYSKLWRGDLKASYMIDGYVQVDFKVVPRESWAYSTLHYTGSKEENIRLRRRANDMGLSLSEYGLKDHEGNLVAELETEKSIYEYLSLPYKEPFERSI